MENGLGGVSISTSVSTSARCRETGETTVVASTDLPERLDVAT